MSQVVNFPTDGDIIRREAAAWVAKMECGDLNQEEQIALNEWVARSPLHKQTLTQLANVWDRMSDAGRTMNEYSEQPVPVVKHCKSIFSAASMYQLVATFLLVLLVPILVYMNVPDADNAEYATLVGQQQNIVLPDGSNILLNTDSALRIAFTSDRRTLHLLRGEAIFDVAKDKTRPFVVKTDSGDVQALGTSFSVRVDDNVVNVLVSHGTVRVRSNEAVDNDKHITTQHTATSSIAEVVVTAGDNVVFDKQRVESVVRESEDAVARKLYWRNGFLAFDDEALSTVVKEVARYTKRQIVIDDDALKSLRVGGYYPINNLETVFASLELNLGLSVNKQGDKYVITQI